MNFYRPNVLRCLDSGNSASSSSSTPQQPTASTAGANSPANSYAIQGNATVTDNGAVQAALNAINQTVQQTIQTLQNVVAQNAQTVAADQGSVSTLANAALSANQALATNVQTGGATTVNQTILYIVIAAVAAVLIAVIGFVSLRRKK